MTNHTIGNIAPADIRKGDNYSIGRKHYVAADDAKVVGVSILVPAYDAKGTIRTHTYIKNLVPTVYRSELG